MTTANIPLTHPNRPIRERVNVRMIVFLAIIAAPFIWIFYIFISQLVTGGVTRHGDYTEVDLKSLGNFIFDQDNGTINDVPARFRELDGKKVALDGFMWSPTSAGDKGTEFQFVYNVSKCCFNGPPQVQERVYGHVPDGSSVTIFGSNDFARVTGILHVRVVRDKTGAIHSVFNMDVESAELRG